MRLDSRVKKDVWKIDKVAVKEMLFLGLPISFQYAVISFGGIILQSSVNLQGSIFIAGYTATNKVYGLLECSATSLGIATSTFVAQNYGARLFDRVKKGVKVSLLLVTITALLTFTFMMFARNLLCSLFINANEVGGSEALFIAVRYLTTMLCSILILYFLHVFRNTLQGIGKTYVSMIAGISELVGRVVAALILSRIFGFFGVCLASPFAWMFADIPLLLIYYFKVVKRKEEKCLKH